MTRNVSVGNQHSKLSSTAYFCQKMRELSPTFSLQHHCIFGLNCFFRINSSGEQEALSACSLQLVLCGGYKFYTAAYLTEKNPDIAKAMSSNFASQCGFCSPGMATKIYHKAIRNKKKALKIQGSKELSDEDFEAEETIKDNLCRCTGYRPILQACKDACQKYATCVDIEDIGNFIIFFTNFL